MEDLRNRWANEQDRLSTLPDELIHHILSLGVDLNVVVQTSVLSKRWVNLWSTFPFLNFTPLRSILASDAKYLNFITKFLLGRAQPVETCSVHLDLNGIDESVGGIVSLILVHAVSHSVEKLHISSVKLDSYLRFPVLKELSLYNCNVSLTDWSLPCLTTLDLKSLCPRSQEFIFSFNQLQCLKNLCLVGCYGLVKVNLRNPEFVRIDLPNLETLTIFQTNPFQFPECKVVISTPKLKTFRFHGSYIPVVSSECGFPCLEHVFFSFDICKGVKLGSFTGMYYYNNILELDDFQVKEIMLKIRSLFSAFGNTKVLMLLPKTIQILSRVLNFFKYQPSPFVNLNELYLVGNAPQLPRYEYSSSSINHVIKYLLSNSPAAKIIPYSPWMPNADGDGNPDCA